MRILNRHERMVPGPPGRVASLLADLDRIWPAQIAAAPRRHGDRRYDAGPMRWEEVDRPGATRAFRVIAPPQLHAEHWFDLTPAGSATVVRHTVQGRTAGKYDTIWRDKIEPLHNLILEALLDNVAAAVAGETRPDSTTNM